MLLTIAICIGGFAMIYAKIDPYTRDFVNAATITPTKAPTKAAKSGGSAANTGSSSNAQPTDTPVPQQPADTPTEAPKPTNTPSGFNPDYKVSSDVRVNLRSGPSRDTDVVTTLDSGTELQYLNQSQPADNPDQDGKLWLKFRTADGEEGWVREIDVSKIG